MKKITKLSLISAMLLVGSYGYSSEIKKENQQNTNFQIGSKMNMNSVMYSLGSVKFSNGFELNATWGIGSGATHKKGDDSNTFYAITDRGVNIDCEEDKDIIGLDICSKGKIFPFADFTPSIVKFQINDSNVVVKNIIPIKDKNGKNISGLSNPISNFSEKAYDINGIELNGDINGIDPEALVALSDGTFWISEEYSSSLLHIDAKGKILKRLVPAGLEKEYRSASYIVEGSLPAIISKRHPNRGIESIALSVDEKSLYFIMQSPLDNPDSDAYKKSPNVRLYKINIADNSNIQEYLYVMDKANTFIKDNKTKTRKQSDVKISEMVTIGDDDLIVLERINDTTKLYRVKLSSGTKVTSEQSANLELNTTSITPLLKTKIFDTDQEVDYPTKIEGIAHLSSDKFLLINDNDFGIEGDTTSIKIATIDIHKK